MTNYNSVGLDLSGFGQMLQRISLGNREEQDKKLALDWANALMGGDGPNRAQELISMGQPVASPPPSPKVPTFQQAHGGAPNRSAMTSLIQSAAAQHGVDPDYLVRTAQRESNFNPMARAPTSSAAGLFQFTKGTAQQYGLSNPFDPVANADAAARLAKDNGAVLQAQGHNAKAPELYAAHFLGAAGADRFLDGLKANPNAPAAAFVEPRQAAANRAIFYNKDGTPKTTAQVYNSFSQSMGADPIQTASAADADAPAAGSQAVGQFNLPGGAGSVPAAQPRAAIPPQMQQQLRQMIAQGGPEMRQQALAYIARASQPTEYKFEKVGDRLVRINPRTGAVEDAGIGGAAKEEWQAVPRPDGSVVLVEKNSGRTRAPEGIGAAPAARDIVDPAERRAAGVPESYTGPVQRKADGTLLMPGAAAPPKPETTYDTETSKAYAKTWNDIRDDADAAGATKNALRVMKGLANDPNFYSGTGGQMAQRFNRAMVAIGAKDPGATSATEAFQAFANEVTLGKLGGKLGAGVSNTDVGFIQQIAPQLSNTQAGNKLIIELSERMVDRKQEVAKLARQYAKENGGRLGPGWDEFIANYSQQNPLFSEADMAKAQAAAAKPPASGNRTFLQSTLGIQPEVLGPARPWVNPPRDAAPSPGARQIAPGVFIERVQ
jgi:hypothetical protein